MSFSLVTRTNWYLNTFFLKFRENGFLQKPKLLLTLFLKKIIRNLNHKKFFHVSVFFVIFVFLGLKSDLFFINSSNGTWRFVIPTLGWFQEKLSILIFVDVATHLSQKLQAPLLLIRSQWTAFYSRKTTLLKNRCFCFPPLNLDCAKMPKNAINSNTFAYSNSHYYRLDLFQEVSLHRLVLRQWADQVGAVGPSVY